MRNCDNCNQEMFEGYCINGGQEYYCSDTCLQAVYRLVDIEDMAIGEDDSDSYWTTWEDDVYLCDKCDEMYEDHMSDGQCCEGATIRQVARGDMGMN